MATNFTPFITPQDAVFGWDSQTGNSSDTYARFGCRVNALSMESLFQLYEKAGFLYPAKKQKLAPYLPVIRENWRRAMRGGELVLSVVTHHDNDGPDASVAYWRSTNQGWVGQHMVSVSSNPLATRAVMLCGQAIMIEDQIDDSCQNWFRPENRFPARVFGSLMSRVGPELASVRTQGLFTYPRRSGLSYENFPVRVVPYDDSHADALHSLTMQTEGPVFMKAEDLIEDPGLEKVKDLYRRLNLRRSRSIWIAYKANSSEPVAAALAYRGPLGMNFCFLENRCHLIANPACSSEDVRKAFSTLLATASQAYEDFELGWIPVVVNEAHGESLVNLGLEFVRRYCQSVWLREGFPAWYRHVDGFYGRVLARLDRKSTGATIQ